MDKPSKSSLARSSSRSKRSNMNLSDLRLSPLSTKFTQQQQQQEQPQGSEGSYDDPPFPRNHSSYLQGKSAPATPGILSRSSSRRRLAGAGLSRKGSLYDNDVDVGGQDNDSYEYAGVVRDEDGTTRVQVGSGKIPKAKSEAALLVQRSRPGEQARRQRQLQQLAAQRSRTGGANTPRGGMSAANLKTKSVEDDWLTRTGAATNAMLQETKGQSWIASHKSSTSLTQFYSSTDDEDDDEGYEELAAQSASASRRQLVDDELSPVGTRASGVWGSKYGSRTASRRTSRRGSVSLTAGSRTPRQDEESAMPTEPDFLDGDEEAEESDAAYSLERLTQNPSFGLGGIVDRLMNWSLFKVEEKEEATEDEAERSGETEEQAKERMAAETRRKKEEKEKLVQRSGGQEGGGGGEQGEGGWADAAWLLSVASKAIF